MRFWQCQTDGHQSHNQEPPHQLKPNKLKMLEKAVEPISRTKFKGNSKVISSNSSCEDLNSMTKKLKANSDHYAFMTIMCIMLTDG